MSSAAPYVDGDEFRKACALFATGVAVATVCDADGSPHGLTVSSFTSVSMEPPIVLVCIDYSCAFLPHFRAASKFAINVLSELQRNISVAFAERPEGRFEGMDWYANESGVPLLRDCLATLECRVLSIVEAGDHAIFLGEVLSAGSAEGRPLLYFNRSYHSLQ